MVAKQWFGMRGLRISLGLRVFSGVAAAALLTNAGSTETVNAADSGPGTSHTTVGAADQTQTAAGASDPGPRRGGAGAGIPLSSLSADQMEYYLDGKSRFADVDSVSGNIAGETNGGLGPTFNANSCGGCHAQPTEGGSSPSLNPQIAAASDAGARNTIPDFITPEGPVREARFPFLLNANGTVSQTPDGGVHDVFTIAGRSDAPGCAMAQPNFAQMQELNNIVFRIPTPLYGDGLIENIPESTIYANMAANAGLKQSLGISGHPNISANDGTVTRFGWKAQNKSVETFAGEAYNVEMGVTNELFTNERELPPSSCLFNATPEDSSNFPASGAQILSDVVAFANFMRFLAPPAPSMQGIPGNPSVQSIVNGRAIFSQIHCDMCHTPSMTTARSSFTAGLNSQPVNLFSDLLVHHMGTGLADNISQGSAGPDEFRTAPLWGAGQRLFFLHDGRATSANGGLVTAIEDHAGSGSEANTVINGFEHLTQQQQQDLLNFLRSL
ncbi:MAG: di-heme oxidoredictase family protein [Acidobacteriaceae bacterium]